MKNSDSYAESNIVHRARVVQNSRNRLQNNMMSVVWNAIDSLPIGPHKTSSPLTGDPVLQKIGWALSGCCYKKKIHREHDRDKQPSETVAVHIIVCT